MRIKAKITQRATSEPSNGELSWRLTNPTANPSNKSHELRRRTHDPGSETHNLGSEAHDPKLELNPQLRQRLFYPLFVSFLSVQSKNLSV